MLLDIRAALASVVAAAGLGLVAFALGAHVYFAYGDTITRLLKGTGQDATAAASAHAIEQRMPTGAATLSAQPSKSDITNTTSIGQVVGAPAAPAGATDANTLEPILQQRHVNAAPTQQADRAPSALGGPFVPAPQGHAAQEPAAISLTTAPLSEAEPAASPAKRTLIRKKKADLHVKRRAAPPRAQSASSSSLFGRFFNR